MCIHADFIRLKSCLWRSRIINRHREMFSWSTAGFYIVPTANGKFKSCGLQEHNLFG